MLKLRVGLVLALAVAALAVLPSVASARRQRRAARSVAAGPWVNHNVGVTFTGTRQRHDPVGPRLRRPTDVEQVISARAREPSLPRSPTPDGGQHGQQRPPVRIDKTAPGLGGYASRRAAHRTSTAGTTTRSPGTSPGATRCPGSGPAPLDVASNGAVGTGLHVHSSCADNGRQRHRRRLAGLQLRRRRAHGHHRGPQPGSGPRRLVQPRAQLDLHRAATRVRASSPGAAPPRPTPVRTARSPRLPGAARTTPASLGRAPRRPSSTTTRRPPSQAPPRADCRITTAGTRIP